ncbi:hypothetical protein GQ457_05G030610 [Hibiscus cannabinus]
MEVKRLKNSLWAKYRREEREWLQKSRLRWFKEGDRNTRFFHITASLRRAQNQISSIKSGPVVVKDPKEVAQVFETHFKQSYNKTPTIPVKSFPCCSKTLSISSASSLESPFSEEEVWASLSVADGNRAPGPDGFNLDFFKRYWPHLKSKVMLFFEDFYKGSLVDPSINHSFIALIPKKPSPETVDDFRPISLVSSLYKILAKVLSRRLVNCIGEVVEENQFAFTPGKQIADCALIANEILDGLNRSKSEALVLKADFKKAYDTIDSSFLDFTLKSMGFRSRWRKWIRMCLSSATVSVLVNGFADDLVIFMKADLVYVKKVKRILRLFEVVSGLQLNLKKTNLFGVNMDGAVVSSWAKAVHCNVGFFPTSYLGFPLGFTINAISIWQPIIEKVCTRLEGWKGKLLSISGRLVLVKSVLSNLPIYYLSLFEIPKSVAKVLNGLMAKFIWGSNSERPIHWLKWDTLTKPKDLGGLGICDVKLKNRALLNKWLWRYGVEPSSLWRRVIASKYGYHSNNLLPVDFYRLPNQCVFSKEPHSRKERGSWAAPPIGCLKFNVDAAVCGSFGAAGIGGILRNSGGLPLFKFAESVVYSDPTGAELKAILKACQLFLYSEWRSEGSLIIESDSLLAVNWINNVCQSPAVFCDLVRECSVLLKQHKWRIIFAYRESNCVAHGLAKMGVNRSTDFRWSAGGV